MKITYRLDLDELELENLREILEYAKRYAASQPQELYFSDYLIEKIANPKKIEYSGKKGFAAMKATEARMKKTKEKIVNAINILRMENKEITPYQVAKVSGVSYNSAKKYNNLYMAYNKNK